MTFDFNKSVAAAKRDYPVETKDVTFINGDDPDAEARLLAFFSGVSRELADIEGLNGPLDDTYKQMAEGAIQNKATSFRDPFTGKGMLYLQSKIPDLDFIQPLSAMLSYSFNHELSHLVMANALPSSFTAQTKGMSPIKVIQYVAKQINRCENKADALGAIRTLAAGDITPEMVGKLALFRSLRALSIGDTDHLTTMLLDTIMLDAKAGNFMSLTPQEAKAVAAAYADKFTPAHKDVSMVAAMHHMGELVGKFGFNTDMKAIFAAATALLLTPDEQQQLGKHARYTAARVSARILASKDEKILDNMRFMHGDDVEAQFEKSIAAIASECVPLDKVLLEFRENAQDATSSRTAKQVLAIGYTPPKPR